MHVHRVTKFCLLVSRLEIPFSIGAVCFPICLRLIFCPASERILLFHRRGNCILQLLKLSAQLSMYSAPLVFIEMVKFLFVSNIQTLVGRSIEKQIGLKVTEQRISSLLLQK